MMFIPPNYNEHEVLCIINKVLDSLVDSFAFGYYDADDMRQEGLIFASQALYNFDPDNDKGCSIEKFLRLHIRNRFLNLRRDKMHRHTPPCLSCAHRKDDHCLKWSDKAECKKWAKWVSRNKAKRSLVESGDTSELEHSLQFKYDDTVVRASNKELIEYISAHIPVHLRADYMRLIEGAPLKKTRKDALVEALRDILGELTNGKELEAWANE
jgi:DNA-directed RNA polymerase specialized sigma24 family protein